MKDLEQELRRMADQIIKLVQVKKNAQYGDAYFKLRDELEHTKLYIPGLSDKYYHINEFSQSGSAYHRRVN